MAKEYAGESWLPIPGYHHYQISNNGRVRSMSRTIESVKRSRFNAAGRVLRPAKLKNGYMQVMLGRGVNKYVHELVLLAFHGPRPDGYTASHLNGIRSDNRSENLRWESIKVNNGRQVEHGTVCRGERNGHARLAAEYVREMRTLENTGYGFFSSLARDRGVSQKTIEDAYKRRTWRHI